MGTPPVGIQRIVGPAHTQYSVISNNGDKDQQQRPPQRRVTAAAHKRRQDFATYHDAITIGPLNQGNRTIEQGRRTPVIENHNQYNGLQGTGTNRHSTQTGKRPPPRRHHRLM
ncbi:hypothetical protein SARC_02831 [Sphaeroforma arctica JP610]|uniref:Uncharacterized protein n=1 Tax=Sphaeroforma arctica JP610 TaxID=667725 RepID=A0A0L0G7V3_9EUKA|nr:hypothetical protein SARC_02831 [Sphaeroforma arctica JP610]KNC84976.1 hypothetical protein SARC_02831 [Sphaeroforma arctica JP610]|eukprot:XP_014158878.1 hypothetical protein SARC_02831 [Sphaeroforma arctica JP610]